jgi:hypothetical protein
MSTTTKFSITSTHRFRQTARSGRCPIRKNRTITLQKKLSPGAKNWLQRRVSQFSTICTKNQPPNLIIREVMATIFRFRRETEVLI